MKTVFQRLLSKHQVLFGTTLSIFIYKADLVWSCSENLSLLNNPSKKCVCVLEYLTGCLDAEDGHSCLWVALELVDQLDPFWGWDTAVDTDITSLEQQRQDRVFKLWKIIQFVMGDSWATLQQTATPAMCTADETPAAQKSKLNEGLKSSLFHSEEEKIATTLCYFWTHMST